MEANIAKVLDRHNNQGALVKLKRKLAASDTAGTFFPDNMDYKLSQQRKFNECNNDHTNSLCPFQRAIGRYYLNFMKSGIPQRVMFYENGQWVDFPNAVLGLVREEFRIKKATVEVHCGSVHYLLDFLHLCQVDMETGSQHPIAWIDEAGGCFFPELSANENCKHLCMENQDLVPDGLKLQFEVDLTGIDNNKVELSGESDIPNKPTPKGVINQHGDCYNKELDVKVHKTPTFSALDFDTVKKMLKHVDGLELVDFHACKGVGTQDRFEMFQKQVDIIKTLRGNSNVRYAWLAASGNSISTLATYGIRFYELPTIKPNLGSGIQLAAVHASHISTSFSHVDGKGIRHMLLCRVILGNMEPIQVGSNQCHPSTEEFDSGADDLYNPMRYVVWTMNMTTHIFPESVVSFKITSSMEGNLIGNRLSIAATCVKVKGIKEASATTHSGCSSNHGFDNSVTQGKAPSVGSKAPRSPWMPFPVLLAAISNEINPKNMDHINHQYALFKDRKISRDDFIKRLRNVAGDGLLRSTISCLQCKAP